MVKRRSLVNFRSFRRRLATAAEQVGQLESEMSEVVGYEEGLTPSWSMRAGLRRSRSAIALKR